MKKVAKLNCLTWKELRKKSFEFFKVLSIFFSYFYFSSQKIIKVPNCQIPGKVVSYWEDFKDCGWSQISSEQICFSRPFQIVFNHGQGQGGCPRRQPEAREGGAGRWRRLHRHLVQEVDQVLHRPCHVRQQLQVPQMQAGSPSSGGEVDHGVEGSSLGHQPEFRRIDSSSSGNCSGPEPILRCSNPEINFCFVCFLTNDFR